MPTINGQGQATIFTEKQLSKFMDTVKSDDDLKGGNYFTLFNLLYYTGERGGCVIQLKWDDIYLKEKVIKFRSETRKGGSSREAIDIHPILLQVLQNYHKRYYAPPSYNPLPNYLFLSSRPGLLSPICRNTLDKKFRSLLIMSGLGGKGFSLHSFRRTFITRIYAANRNVKECMAITGHKSVAQFMKYVEANPERIKQTIEAL